MRKVSAKIGLTALNTARLFTVTALSMVFAVTSARADIFEGCYKGLAAQKAGNNDLGIEHFTRCIKRHDLKVRSLAGALYNRGIACGKKNDYDRAILKFDLATRLKPDYALAFNNRGFTYRLKGDYDKAIRDYDEAIRLKSGYALAYLNRGFAYRLKGDEDQAIQDFKEAIRLKPGIRFNLGYAEAYNNWGPSSDAASQ